MLYVYYSNINVINVISVIREIQNSTIVQYSTQNVN